MEIVARHDEMRTGGTKVKNLGEKYKGSLKELYEVVDSLSSQGVWEGQDEEKYVSTVQELKPGLESLGDKIEEYGNFIVSSSEAYQATQEDAMSKM